MRKVMVWVREEVLSRLALAAEAGGYGDSPLSQVVENALTLYTMDMDREYAGVLHPKPEQPDA